VPRAQHSKLLHGKAGATFTLTVLSCLFLKVAAMPQDADRPRPEPKLTFPAAARLVQVSVLVHDKKGAPVSGLAASDFQLFEQGKEQSIETFTVESELESAVSSARATRGPQTEFSNQNEGRGGVTIVLLDRLNTAWEDQMRARDQIVSFLGEVQPNDRVGLYLLDSNTVRVLHDFTDDTASLRRSLARYQGGTSRELAASTEKSVETGDNERTQMDAWLAETDRVFNAAFLRNRAENTCDALIALANHLASVHGRKNLIWVSSAFPLTFDDGKGHTETMTEAVRRASRSLSEAGIAVYPVDARGLVGSLALPSASTPSSTDTGRVIRGAPSNLAIVTSFADTAEMIAKNTGGRAFYNTNDLSGAIRRAVDDARVTYLIGYSPSHGEWNGRFREIKVKVKRPGVEVRHRKGYLAFPLPEASKGRLGSIIAKAVESPLQASGIAVSVRLERAGGPANRDVNLAIRVDAKAITFEQKADTFQCTIALTVAQTDAQGRMFKDFVKNVDFNLTREVRDQWLSEGVVLHRKITLRDDVHELRVAVGDRGTMATGSVVIPIFNPSEKPQAPERPQGKDN
jgi:VWFA-related protein